MAECRRCGEETDRYSIAEQPLCWDCADLGLFSGDVDEPEDHQPLLPDGGTRNQTSTRVGPITFSDETARTQLIENGVVTTFRAEERTTGNTWWREHRTGSKRGDVHVEHVAKLVPTVDALEEFRAESGFDTAADWRTAIADLNNGWTGMGHVYRVTKR